MNSYISVSYNFDHGDVGASTGEASADVLIEYVEHKQEMDYKGVQRIC
ncbi:MULTISPECIES: hypothetical protein [unclassified Saccharicrinis]